MWLPVYSVDFGVKEVADYKEEMCFRLQKDMVSRS